MRTLGITILFAFALMFCSCSNESYETGDGAYSYMRADLVDAHVDGNMVIDYVNTDDGERLVANNDYTISWAKTGDKDYRTLLYYNKVATNSNSNSAEIITASWVPVLTLDTLKSDEQPVMDPVTFNSAWLSANKKYINIGFSIKTGRADNDSISQTIGLLYFDTMTLTDGKTLTDVIFSHDQGGVPEYYSQQYYASIRTSQFDTDIVRIRIKGYDGEVMKEFSIK